MKKLLIIFALVTACCGVASTARAANETIDLSMEAGPSAGPLYRELARPVAARLDIKVSNPPAETTITPLKVANVTFPADMSFYPDPKKTPTCPESRIGVHTPLSIGILGVVAYCPGSVVGTGTAVVQLGRSKGPEPVPTLKDPRLVIFNAGRDKAGRPKITIYGFSKYVNTGILMKGTLARNGELKIDVGVLPFDSSVSQFTFDVPGEGMEIEDGNSPTGFSTVKGLDPGYLRASCSTGSWKASGAFVLGRRDEATGFPLGDEYFLSSNDFEIPCKGQAGKARLKVKRISGPARIKAGRRGNYTVTLANPGTATARSVKLVASGGAAGSVKVGAIAPRTSKKFRIQVRATSRPRKASLRLRVSGKGVKTIKSRRILTIG